MSTDQAKLGSFGKQAQNGSTGIPVDEVTRSTDIEQATVERMVRFVRSQAGYNLEATQLVALLPPPVDPDLVTAREIYASMAYRADTYSYDIVINGGEDNSMAVRVALAALRKAREEGARP